MVIRGIIPFTIISRTAAVVPALLFLPVVVHAANPPICPHVIYWNSTINSWAQGAPWIKVILKGDLAPAKNTGAKVLFRPLEVPGGDGGACYDGVKMAQDVLNILNQVPIDKWPDAVGYRNEFNDENTTTPVEFIKYYDTLRAGGYTGWIVYGSYGVGWPDMEAWALPQVQAAVNKADAIELHEYFDLTIAWYESWLAHRHVRVLNTYPYVDNKPMFIGEFGSDRVSQVEDPELRRGWQDRGKLTAQQFIDQIEIYRKGDPAHNIYACADNVVAVLLFQQGSPYWPDFEVIGTPVADYMRTTWSRTPGAISGWVRNASNNPVGGATVSTNVGGYLTTTTADGSYTLSNVQPWTYSVTARKTGLASQTKHAVSVQYGQTAAVNFNLGASTTGTISGYVRDSLNSPISGAAVSTNTGGYATTSGPDGSYTLAEVAAGAYSVTAGKVGYYPQTIPGITVTAGGTVNCNFNLRVQPVSILQNGGFENGTPSPWVRFGQFDDGGDNGIQTGIWYMGLQPHSGTYFAGSAASWGNKNGGFYQQVSATPGQLYRLAAWVNTYQRGGSNSNTTNRIGIDPTGGTNSSSSSIVWTPRTWTDTAWAEIAVPAVAASPTMTVFLEAQQLYPVEWNLNAFDDMTLIPVPFGTIAQIKSHPDGTEVGLVDKVVTAGTTQMDGAFYIEEMDRSSAIRVVTTAIVDAGDKVTVTGILNTPSTRGERLLNLTSLAVKSLLSDFGFWTPDFASPTSNLSPCPSPKREGRRFCYKSKLLSLAEALPLFRIPHSTFRIWKGVRSIPHSALRIRIARAQTGRHRGRLSVGRSPQSDSILAPRGTIIIENLGEGSMILAIAALVLALAGFADMSYATFLHYGWLGPSPTAAPFCPPEGGSCPLTFRSPQAEVLGLPITIFGMVYYALISLAAVVRLVRGDWPFRPFLIAVPCLAAAFSIYLAWLLIFYIHAACPLCLFAHAINLSLAVIFLAALRRPQPSLNLAGGHTGVGAGNRG